MGIDAKISIQSGQLAGLESLNCYEKLAIRVIYSAIQDYVADRRWDGMKLINGRDEEYFNSRDFEVWCSYLKISPASIRSRLDIEGDLDPVRVGMNNRLNALLQEIGL